MALATLIAITLACISWSLWIRRVTWSCRWEVAATLNIALQGIAVILMSPLASETLGHWLHALTGMWNLEDYIGHKLPRRGPPRPDVAARNWRRWRDPADVEDRWRAFRSRSDARAKAWQQKHRRARER